MNPENLVEEMESSPQARELPLEGVRVLDLATVIAGPYCAEILGEFGAEVLKIEQPNGGCALRRFGTPTKLGDTLTWMSEARNKKSLTLDLRTEKGSSILKRLAEDTDVVVENFRPGTMEKWGVGWEVLKAINPKLVMLRVTGYGQTGPYKDRPGFARVAHAVGGLAYLSGMPKGVPVTPGSTTLGDYLTGLYGSLQHEAIQAQLAMSQSPNHTTVYIPSGENGIPIIKTAK